MACVLVQTEIPDSVTSAWQDTSATRPMGPVQVGTSICTTTRYMSYLWQKCDLNVKVHSHQAKANAKAKIKKQSEQIKQIKFKHQRKFLLLRSLSLDVNEHLYQMET